MRYLSILLLSAGLIPVTGWVAPAADASGAAKPQGAKVALETVMPEPIYVAIQSSGRVEVLPSGETWSGIEGAHYDALSSDGRWLLVSGLKTGKAYLIDTQSGELSTRIEIGELAQGVKISPDDRYGVAVAAKQGTIVVIDLSTQQVAKTIRVGDTPHNIRFSADGELAYVTLQGEGAIAMVDMQTLEKRRTIATPGLDTPHNLDFSEDGRYLWIRDFVGRVGVLDLKTKEMVQTFEVGDAHGGIDVIPGGEYVATSAIAGSKVTLIDAEDREIAARVEVGNGPHGVRASADGRYLYVAVTGEDAVAVVDMQSLEVVRHQPVDGSFPFWIAVPGNR
ncbi:YVTN beta-propeller repeat-containing protein [Salinisphaera shabanensis T35B1]|jgi:DNA-binding beta-propeller fold protein YncE|uniref:YncE family protein n=1 Tax=Salinisphaera TaxID=180541 RepID=UPI0002120E29